VVVDSFSGFRTDDELLRHLADGAGLLCRTRGNAKGECGNSGEQSKLQALFMRNHKVLPIFLF
jgi:hypothetical protein